MEVFINFNKYLVYCRHTISDKQIENGQISSPAVIIIMFSQYKHCRYYIYSVSILKTLFKLTKRLRQGKSENRKKVFLISLHHRSSRRDEIGQVPIRCVDISPDPSHRRSFSIKLDFLTVQYCSLVGSVTSYLRKRLL